LLQKNISDTPKNWEKFKLPQDVIDACREIWDKVCKASDPTKISHIWVPNRRKYKLDTKYEDEIIISLIFRWIINVCEVVQDWENNTFSIPINPEQVEERLEYNEIIADILLYQVLSWCQDRKLIYQDDYRSDFWEHIWPHNCRIFPQGTYSIFDIVWTFPKIPRNQVEAVFYYELRYLFWYDDNESRSLQDFFDTDLAMAEKMKDRILKNARKLLERYEWEGGKKFFLTQCAQASFPYNSKPWSFIKGLSEKEDFWYDGELEIYDNLVFSLTNIITVFEEWYYDLFSSKEFIREDCRNKFRYHIWKAWEYFKRFYIPKIQG